MKEQKKQDGHNGEASALKTVDTSHASLPQTPVDQNANGSITYTDETSQI